jgi:hypothetical protein
MAPRSSPCRRVLAVPRALVSQNKRRFKQDGFDLDLGYVHPRVIVMGPCRKNRCWALQPLKLKVGDVVQATLRSEWSSCSGTLGRRCSSSWTSATRATTSSSTSVTSPNDGKGPSSFTFLLGEKG